MNIVHNHADCYYTNALSCIIISNITVCSVLYYSSFDSYYNSDNYNNTSYSF